MGRRNSAVPALQEPDGSFERQIVHPSEKRACRLPCPKLCPTNVATRSLDRNPYQQRSPSDRELVDMQHEPDLRRWPPDEPYGPRPDIRTDLYLHVCSYTPPSTVSFQ